MAFAAVVFDLDGTLIDSEPVFRVVAKRAAWEFDKDFTDALYLALIGLPGPEVESGILDEFGADFPIGAFKERFAAHWEIYVKDRGIEIKTGVIELLDQLDGLNVPFAIATSTAHKRARESLRLAGIEERFSMLVGGDEIENGKPAPDIFLSAAKMLNADPQSCVAIEDSKVGVHAAAAAEMYTIMVPDLKAPDEQTRAVADEIHPSMTDAIPAVLRLLNQ